MGVMWGLLSEMHEEYFAVISECENCLFQYARYCRKYLLLQVDVGNEIIGGCNGKRGVNNRPDVDVSILLNEVGSLGISGGWLI